MSILIRGMEMPNKKNGAVLIIYPDGRCAFENGEEYKAVPVPPHGDLIDRDALRAEVKKHATPSDAWVFSLIRTAPTIIPAEEGE